MGARRIFVAGHRGMVGAAICRQLDANDEFEVITKSKSELNLCDQNAVNNFLKKERPTEIVLAAAKVGGIYANSTFPAEFIYEKKQMDWHGNMLIERVESVMKDWPIFIGFLKVLHSLDFFDTVESVISYLDNPTSKEKLFALWQEMGCPQVNQDKQWDLFFSAAMNLKEENNGRSSKETE